MKLKYSIIALLYSLCNFANAQKLESEIVKNLKTDITYLSTDAMQGRLAGSPEDKLAAEYIADQFKKAGLTPYNGLAFQTFDIVQFRIATSKSKFEFHFKNGDSSDVTKLTLFKEYFPLNESGMNDSIFALPVHCGFGIDAPSLGLNSYTGLGDIKGKIFIISLGFPGDDTAKKSPLIPFAEISAKIQAAIAHGAAGIVFTPGSPMAEKPKGELQRNAKTYPMPIVYMDKIFYPLNNMYVKMVTSVGAPTNKAYNVFGYRNNHKKNTVIICAHHDHLGHNEFNNSLYSGPEAIHNGADDNASGVAAMLQLAKNLKGKKYKKNNYLFIGFSGEELGLLGSKFFLQQNIISKNKINYAINIDMLGRLDSQSKTLVISGTGTSPVWHKSLSKIKNDSNILRIVTSASGLGPSDHASFYLDSIPVLHFFSGQHSDYHKPSDDENKINYHGIYLSLNIIQQMVSNTNKSGKIKFTKTKDVQPGRKSFKVTMGVMPDYTYTGAGMRLDGISDGKPAMKAGLQRGDILTKIGNYPVNSVQDYMKALQTFDKGMTIQVQYTRNGENKTVEVLL